MTKTPVFGILGMILGFLGVLCSLCGPKLVEALHQTSFDAPGGVVEAASDFAAGMAEKSKQILGGKPDAGRNEGPPAAKLAGLLAVAGLFTGVCALFCGMVGWVRGESHRACASAALLGLLAVTWVYTIAGVALLLAAVIIAAIFS